MNQAMLMKLCWGLISSSESLWAKVLGTKYGINPVHPPVELPNKNCSYFWRSISKLWNTTIKGIGWSIGNGEYARFWWDCWATKKQPLIDYAIAPIGEDILQGKVVDFVNQKSQWKWEIFSPLLPNHILLKIASIQLPRPERGKDQVYWLASSKGNFTVRSAYHYLASSERHIVSNGNCDRCGLELESTLYVLRDCPMAQRIWSYFVPQRSQVEFYSKPLKGRISGNLQSKETFRKNLD
ncbi:putative ribonuclease H protein [Citrus sinensis]|nr:putative ribonuclease H protein [Citrus sinensis]